MQLELILSGGSNLSDEVRESCLDVFGSRIVDLYGTAEVGLIAYQCPDCDEYHMCFENNFTEIIKDNGHPAEPGEQGRVIVTTFRNDAMPLVRFEIGDYAERGFGVGPCANQPFTLRRIIGRSKMLFIRPDGSKYWPRIGHEAMVPAGVKRYRCIQLARNTIEFLYLPVDDQGADETAILSALRHFLGTDIEFKIKEVGDEEDLYHPKKLIFECMI